jgi:hypothetical protein
MIRYIPFTNFVILPIIFGFLITIGDPSKTIQDFSLKNVDNKTISTKAFPDAKGFIVVFIFNE